MIRGKSQEKSAGETLFQRFPGAAWPMCLGPVRLVGGVSRAVRLGSGVFRAVRLGSGVSRAEPLRRSGSSQALTSTTVRPRTSPARMRRAVSGTSSRPMTVTISSSFAGSSSSASAA